MKGYRICSPRFLGELAKTKRPLVNTNGRCHKMAKNNFKKSNYIRCFWFFKSLEDALNSFWAIGTNEDVILEFEISENNILEEGKGNYNTNSFGIFEETNECTEEFTTLKISPNWLSALYYVKEEVEDWDEDGYEIYSHVIEKEEHYV